MKTQKFVAPTMKDALARIKEELGEDALILKSEKVRAGGSLGLVKQDMIEVTAASPEEVKAQMQRGPEFADSLQQSLEKAAGAERTARAPEGMLHLAEEVRRLREDLADIGNQLKYSSLAQLPKELARLRESMDASGLSGRWVTDLTQEALVQLGADQLFSAQEIEDYIVARLARVVKPAPQLTLRRTAPYKIALVGGPGAGKTTLLQKLASDPLAYGKRKVGLISLDTHRMAAVEQLRTFARIAGTAMEVLYQAEHCAAALARLATCEIILVDTPGCPVWDRERLDLLHGFIERLDVDEIHLVLNALVRDEDLIFAGRRFRDVGITHLSFTRLDESLRQGGLVNVVRASERPVSWLSKGQGFIGQIERFTTDHLRRWIVQSQPLPEIVEPSAVSESTARR